MEAVSGIARAIATMEGFYKSGSLAQRNHNPGNLRSWGSLPVRDGYVVFPNEEAGWSALSRQVRKNIDRGLTLEEFFAGKPGVYGGYAPAADQNRPLEYARFVSQATGVPLGSPIRQFEAGEVAPDTGELNLPAVEPVTEEEEGNGGVGSTDLILVAALIGGIALVVALKS